MDQKDPVVTAASKSDLIADAGAGIKNHAA